MSDKDDAEIIECPVCGSAVTERQQRPGSRDSNFYDCPNCGQYLIDRTPLARIEGLDIKARAILSEEIWRSQSGDQPFEISSNHLTAAESAELPDPAEQLDLLVLFLGQHQETPGAAVKVAWGNLRAKIGAVTRDDESFILNAAVEGGFVDNSESSMPTCSVLLTMRGWERFHEIQRGAVHSRIAFMAMPFGNDTVKRMVDEVFRSAVKETGFDLKRLDDSPPAGLIDNRLRVEIRLCRFLIADLTDANNGAYWEAGYAEGLEKPVIYTCSKEYFDEHKTHFDTNHQHTIVWDPTDAEKAAEDLKATIRATLPFEAKMPEE